MSEPLTTGADAPADAPSDTRSPVAFAVVSSSSHAAGHLEKMCAELTRALSRPVTARVLPSYAALEQEVREGRAQIAWAPPLVALDLERAGLVSIELCCARGGQIGYHAALFTRHASPIESLADLAGKHAAWVDVHSAAGYLLPRTRLVDEGLDPDHLFGRESFLGTHAKVARAVLEGDADVGATYVALEPGTGRPVSAGWLDAGAGINGAFILATTGPIPSDAIVFSSRLAPDEKAALVAQVTALPGSVLEAVSKLLGADGFAPPPAAHFEALRALAVRVSIV
jgi:phosphate/phosphite/phosphonate ABC transporter binding protein